MTVKALGTLMGRYIGRFTRRLGMKGMHELRSSSVEQSPAYLKLVIKRSAHPTGTLNLLYEAVGERRLAH